MRFKASLCMRARSILSWICLRFCSSVKTWAEAKACSTCCRLFFTRSFSFVIIYFLYKTKTPGCLCLGSFWICSVVFYTLSPGDPRRPGILFTVAKPRDQACAWWHMVGFNSESKCSFIISPIVVYLWLCVNHKNFCVVFMSLAVLLTAISHDIVSGHLHNVGSRLWLTIVGLYKV